MARTYKLPSASKLELLDYCQFFPKLPKDPDKPNEKAETGKYVHALIERESTGCEVERHELVNEKRADKIFARWKAWWPKARKDRIFWPEVACLYNYETGAVRLAEADWVKRGRPRQDSEIACIIDAVYVAPDKSHGVLLDWKTGAYTTKAEYNRQLHLGALCVYRLFNVPEVRVGLVYLKQIKDPVLDVATMTAMDLVEFEAQMRERIAAVPSSRPTPGDHCFKCPSKSKCPAMTGEE